MNEKIEKYNCDVWLVNTGWYKGDYNSGERMSLEITRRCIDAILNNEVSMVINTTEGRQSIKDSYSIRRSALEHSVFLTTTISGGFAIVESLEQGEKVWSYDALQNS